VATSSAPPPKPPAAPPPPGSKPQAAYTAAKLTDGTDEVVFQFLPTNIKIGHSADTKAMNRTLGISEGGGPTATVVAGNGGDAIVNVGDTTLSFGDLIFDGKDVVTRCIQLLRWTYPVKVKTTDGKAPTEVSMSMLTFAWGSFTPGSSFGTAVSGRETKLVLSKVDVDYSRFDSYGKPHRAKVSLSCKVLVQGLDGQNPTSGGLPDRGGHLVTDGENLMGIAVGRYGTPSRWRDLAVRNGIDDPLRVRAGDRVYLPDPTELRGSRP
jgi:hypothetical protein